MTFFCSPYFHIPGECALCSALYNSTNVHLSCLRHIDKIQFVCFLGKGLERLRLIGSAVAGFNHARTTTNASAKGLDIRQDEYTKEICSPGSLVNNPVR